MAWRRRRRNADRKEKRNKDEEDVEENRERKEGLRVGDKSREEERGRDIDKDKSQKWKEKAVRDTKKQKEREKSRKLEEERKSLCRTIRTPAKKQISRRSLFPRGCSASPPGVEAREITFAFYRLHWLSGSTRLWKSPGLQTPS